MAGEGAVYISVNMSVSEAEKQLERLTKDILKQESTLSDLKAKYNDVTAAVREMIAASGNTYLEEDIQKAVPEAAQLADQIRAASVDLENAKTAAGALEQRIQQGATAGKTLANMTDAASVRMERFTKRIAGLAKRVFVFTLITMALRQLRGWMSSAIKTNDEAAAAIGRLKGALLTLAQPIWNVVIPAFTTLVNILAKVLSAIAAVFAVFSGSSVEASKASAEALNDEMTALNGVGGAAKKAEKQMASFDEINQIGDKSGGGGGGGGGASAIAPDFSGVTEISDQFRDIAANVLAVGAGLLAWKIASNFTSDLKTLGGIAAAVAGAFIFIYNAMDAWNNGVDWDNLTGMIGGLAIAMIGLYAAFGPVAAGIAGIVGGLAMLAVGFRDAQKSGMNWQNTALMMAGLMATGLGLSLMTGSFIPLFIAALGAGLLAIVQFTGHGAELMDGLTEVFEGFALFFKGVFTGDMEQAVAGLKMIGEGFAKAWGAVVQSVKDAWGMFLDWFNEKTDYQFVPAITFIGETIDWLIGGIKEVLEGLILFIEGVFTGDWKKAWEGVAKIFKAVFNGIIDIAEGAINFIIDCLNRLSFDVPDWVPKIGGSHFGFDLQHVQIPRLATGAVIPPNREFLAVLGDQKSGTNIEAPLDTIVEAFRQAMREGGTGGSRTFILECNKRQFAQLVLDLNALNEQRVGVRLGGVV